MPRRVVDGIVSELLRRRLWCLAAASLSGAGSLSDLVVTLRERGREVVLLSDDSAVGDPVGDPTVGRFAYVAEACARYGVSTADTVMVCADLSGDTALFGPEGARVLVVDERVAPVRGVVAVATIEQVRQLFDQAVSYRATSTYHEV